MTVMQPFASHLGSLRQAASSIWYVDWRRSHTVHSPYFTYINIGHQIRWSSLPAPYMKHSEQVFPGECVLTCGSACMLKMRLYCRFKAVVGLITARNRHFIKLLYESLGTKSLHVIAIIVCQKNYMPRGDCIFCVLGPIILPSRYLAEVPYVLIVKFWAKNLV